MEDCRHEEAHRKNNPPAETASNEVRGWKTQSYSYNPHLDPGAYGVRRLAVPSPNTDTFAAALALDGNNVM